MIRILHGDILSFARHYKGDLFHALFCDAPYHLATITKRFGKEDSAPAQHGKDGAFARASAGFMGKDWDSDIAFQPETWRAMGKLLYPGAFGMTFAGSRTFHRIAVAIEDAGFIIHPMIGWVYASGFPKATRIDKQIDKHGGQSIGWFGKWLREYRKEKGIKQKELAIHFPSKTGGLTGCVANWELGLNTPTVVQFNKLCEVLDLPFGTIQEAEREIIGKDKARSDKTWFTAEDWDITKPATDLARAWEGHRYGLQALKPALEPIIVFQKPYEGRPIDDILETGAGALNIDGGRIGTEDTRAKAYKMTSKGLSGGGYGTGKMNYDRISLEAGSASGRWPANIVLSHSPECELVGYRDADNYPINRFTDGAKPFGDGAGHEYETEIIEAGQLPVYECVDGCAVRALDEQTGTLRSGAFLSHHKNTGGKPPIGTFEIRDRSGENNYPASSGGASRFFFNADYMYERLEEADPMKYQAKASKSERNAGLAHVGETTVDDGRQKSIDNAHQRGETKRQNPHPTLKPIALLRWLTTLLLPPDEYAPRRILVPFAGTGSEMIGAFQAGWEQIIGVELEAEYVDIAKARIKYWESQGIQLPMFTTNTG